MKCNVCKSEYRIEIEALAKRKVSRADIARKYFTLMGVSEIALYQTLQRHFNKKHPPLILTPKPMEERRHVDFEEYADKLLQVGAQSIEESPSKVSHSHVIAAKRTLIEEAKARNAIDATKLMFLKFFRGQEGEIIDAQPIREEALPTNTDR